MKALVSLGKSFHSAYPNIVDELRGLGLEVSTLVDYDYPAPEEEVVTALKGAEIYIMGVERVTRAVIDSATSLKLLLKHGAGYDNIDVDYAKQKGIAVAFDRGQNAASVAELAFGLMLAVSRGIALSDRRMRGGDWRLFMGDELEGKTLGLIGAGAIGLRVAKYALAFDMRVIAHDPYVNSYELRKHGIMAEELDALLVESDYVSLHVPATKANYGMINAEKLTLMKKSAYLINTSRGEIIDEDALVAALRSGVIKAAALDVFCTEPPRADILALDNLLATPHIGGSSFGGARHLCEATVENVRRYLHGEPLLNRL